jgi:hypothetical protein
LVAVIGSVVGQAGSGVAATGWMRTVGVSLLRWGWVGTWLDVTPRSCQNTLGDPGPGDQQKMRPHGLRVVVVVVDVVVGRRVVVVVGRVVVVVVVVTAVVVEVDAPVVVVVVVDVVVPVVVVEVAELVLDAVVPVAVTARLGCSLRLTTTISPTSVGGRPCGARTRAACDARSAATAAPIRAPKARRPEPPKAVSINYDYRPHSFGSNRSGHLVPA